MLLHRGNAYFEGGDVGQEGPRGEGGQLPLSVLLRRQQGHKLDLDYCTGKTKHTPRERRAAAGREMEGARGQKKRDGAGLRQRRRASPLEDPVHEHAVLPQTPEGEPVRLVVGDLQVSPGDEARVAHVDVHGAVRRVPAYGDRPLAHHELKVPALESSQGLRRRTREAHGEQPGVGASFHHRWTQEGERGLVIGVRGHRDAHGTAWCRL
ncbi:hypothetical protein EYF80_055113 [Liparis tanakae]|uniref:Uncharacterized protein n=1 Tax=Liparis tanakae TaxID=230148 RepID=A0A4Z2F0Q3_9TELE|nr:hypothetical protein EYF80_055113 [Liparis tanakae]